MSWGKPYRITSPELNGISPESTLIQLASGAQASVALMASGDVIIWNVFGRRAKTIVGRKMSRLGITDNLVDVHPTQDGVLPCVTFDATIPVYRIARIPTGLPELCESQRGMEPKLVKIAPLAGRILLGLTNKGHLLKFSWESWRGEDGVIVLAGAWIYARLLVVLCLHTLIVNQMKEFSELQNYLSPDRILPDTQNQNLRFTHVRISILKHAKGVDVINSCLLG